MQKIVPHLWFDTQASEAAEFYSKIFPNAKVTHKNTLHGTPGGDSEIVSFSIDGYNFMAISAGPYFKINPSISFMVNFDPSRDDNARDSLKKLWDQLIDGGAALMPLDEYPFSKLYGWVQDKFGVNWQLILSGPDGEPRPFIVPSLLFAGDQTNNAEEALRFYVDVFKDSKVGLLAHYPEKTGPANKGSLMFGDCMLENQWFALMDSGVEQPFKFNEAVSLLINCDTQEEIDYYWEKLSAIPQAEQCGWLCDKYGVSWQVSATRLHEMMTNGTPQQIDRVTQAFLKMKKFNLAELEAAYKND